MKNNRVSSSSRRVSPSDRDRDPNFVPFACDSGTKEESPGIDSVSILHPDPKSESIATARKERNGNNLERDGRGGEGNEHDYMVGVGETTDE